MNALRSESAAGWSRPPMCGPVPLVGEVESPWAARGLGDLVPPATLAEARERRDELAHLLGRERAAATDFLLALADFDRRRGWERLGHAGLFAFLKRELHLSNGAAHLRSTAARLLPQFPEVEEALRAGRLCLSAVGELARVLTPENRAEVLPRFFGCSFREAREVAAAMVPRVDLPRREVVTTVSVSPRAMASRGPAQCPAAPTAPSMASAALAASPLLEPTPAAADRQGLVAAPGAGAPLDAGHGDAVMAEPGSEAVRTSELPRTDRARARPLDDAEPLDAEHFRLHLTVSRRLLDKVAAARAGLSHAHPGASTEQVLEAALDLLLERQARAKALVKRPGAGRAASPATPPAGATGAARASGWAAAGAVTGPTGGPAPRSRRVPAAVEREVRLRDGDRCQFPLDAGGVCGATFLVQLDHLVPLALGGQSTPANLRCTCAAHNRYAARLALGEAVMEGALQRPRR